MSRSAETVVARRTFTKLAVEGAAAGAFPSALVGAEGTTGPVPGGDESAKAPCRVLWNDDTTHVPKWTPGEVFTHDMLRGAIDSVADKGIDAYMLSPGLGWVPWWQSKVYPYHYEGRLLRRARAEVGHPRGPRLHVRPRPRAVREPRPGRPGTRLPAR